MWKYLLLSTALLASCGPTSKSTVHSSKEWKAHKNNSTPLPSVTLKIGERTLAYRNRIGFPPMFGGYIPSLVTENPEIAKIDLVPQNGGAETYLTGLKPGTTKIYQANGMVKPDHQRENITPRAFLYSVQVEE